MSKTIIECCGGIGSILFNNIFDLSNEKSFSTDFDELKEEAESYMKWRDDEDMPLDMIISYGLHKYNLITIPYKLTRGVEDKIECVEIIDIYTWMPSRTINFPF